MLRIYECLAVEHDPRILSLALLLCYFAASTAIIMGQRALAAEPRARWAWLLAAGTVTGIGIWTTHFAAMLAYQPRADIHLDPRFTVAAFACTVGFSVGGWICGFASDRRRPLLGGALIGLGLAGGHFLDTFGIRFAGYITLDADLVVVSLLAGIPLCILATHLLSKHAKPGIPIASSLALACGIVVLHLTAMAALTLVDDPLVPVSQDGLGLNTLGGLVIAAAVSILAAGFALGVHDRYSASIVAEDRRRLSESLNALKQSREHYQSTLELNPQIPWTADPSGNCLEIGSKWSEYIGLPVEVALGSGWLSAVHPEDRQGVEEIWHRSMVSGECYDTRFRIKCHDGVYRWFRDRGRPRRDADGAIVKWYGSLDDIHEQVVAEHSLRESEERYRLASRATNDAIWDWRHDTERINWGGAIGTHLGYHDAVKGTTLSWWAERVHEDDRDDVVKSLREALARGDTHWSKEYRFLKADGTYADILSRGYVVRTESGEAVRSIGAMRDITELKRTEVSLRRAAHHDPLTGLPNRALFQEQLEQCVREAERAGSELGLMILDVDHFKLFNDTRGHHAGDRLLCWIAEQLTACRRPGAMVARLGGDEFAVILPDFKDSDRLTVLSRLRKPFRIEREVLDVTVSAGLSVWPKDAEGVQDLLKSADLALYACKEKRNGVRRFQPVMREAADARARMLELASSALRDGRICAHYQPKVCLKTGTLIGMEALLRWQHPTDGLQAPGSIAAAFETGELAVKITDRILDCVVADMKEWLDKGLPIGRVAVNAAPADFRRGDLAKRLLDRLESAGVPAKHIELEVTENVLVDRGAERVGNILKKLRRAGVTIALDDFGTGYASLSHLNAFPVDVLKIDQSFVSRLSARKGTSEHAIVRAIIGLAENIGIQTVAEGVETMDQATRLKEMACDAGQGYLFSRPVAPEQVANMLTHGLLTWPSLVRPQPVASRKAAS